MCHRRFVFAVVSLAIVLSACNVATAQPATQPSGDRPDTRPKQIDKSDRGFTLTSSAGWFERSDGIPPHVALQLIYTILPQGQRDAASFRVYVRSQPAGQTLEQTAEAWKKLAAHDQPATYQVPQEIELDGLKALALRSEATAGGRAVIDRSVIAIRGAQSYVLHTEAPKNVADRAIQSAIAMEKTWKWRGEVPAHPAVAAASTRPRHSTGPASADPVAGTMAVPAGKKLFNGWRHGFRLAYPESWYVPEEFPVPQMKFAAYPGGEPPPPPRATFAGHLALIVEGKQGQPAEGVTAKALAEQLFALSQRDNGAELIESAALEIDGVEAYRIIEKHKLLTFNLQRMLVCAVKDGRRYSFQFVAERPEFEKHLAVMKEVVESVKWVGPVRRPVPAASASRPATATSRPARVARIRVSPQAAAKVEAASKDLRKYDDGQAGLRFSYPSAWKEIKPDDPTTVMAQLAPDAFGGELEAKVTIVRMDKNALTPDVKKMARILALASAEGQKELAAGECKISGSPGYQVSFAGAGGARSFVAAVEHNNYVYTFAFVASDVVFEAWLPTFQKMIESVQWTG